MKFIEASAVNWPAIVVREDDPELVYVQHQDFLGEIISSCEDEDILIDSGGIEFSLTPLPNLDKSLAATGNTKTLDEILGLIKAHAALAGSCCVAKIYAPSIPDAFAMVKSLEQDETRQGAPEA